MEELTHINKIDEYELLNILEIILSCINSEAILQGKKSFLITDVTDKNTLSILKTLNYNIKNLLEIEYYLRWVTSDYGSSDPNKEESEAEEKRLDNEFERECGKDTCDNCGHTLTRKHDCNEAVCGEENNHKGEGDVEETMISIDDIVRKLIEHVNGLKKDWKDVDYVVPKFIFMRANKN